MEKLQGNGQQLTAQEPTTLVAATENEDAETKVMLQVMLQVMLHRESPEEKNTYTLSLWLTSNNIIQIASSQNTFN